jgi:fermentation-respiration switch protein FrsA (DUF1100 family)
VAVTALAPDIPLFLLHGTRDAIIHVEHSLRLYAAAREPKQLWVAEGSAHCALYNSYRDEYEVRVLGFIRSCVEAAEAARGGEAAAASGVATAR